MNATHWSDLPLVLTSKQAAAVLQLKPRTIANMLDRGDLRGVKIGKEWRISRAELMRFALGASGGGLEDSPPALTERIPAVINKSGILVVQAEPVADLVEFVNEERDRRVAALLEQVGL